MISNGMLSRSEVIPDRFGSLFINSIRSIQGPSLIRDPSVCVREGMSLQLRTGWYNLFHRTMFGVPARTVISTVPIGRITTPLNPSGYVNSARIVGSRQRQFALRFIF